MNAAILFTIHGNLKEIYQKTCGDFSRVNEFLLIKKFSENFDKVFIFSDDKEDYSHFLPENCIHVKLRNPIIYIIFGWLVFLYYARKYKIKAAHLVGSPALPLIFLKNFADVKTVLEYNYLWHKAYEHDITGNLKDKIKKNIFIAKIVRLIEKFLVNNFVDYIILGTNEALEMIKDKNKILPIKKGIILDAFDPEKVKKHEIYKKIRGKTIVFIGRLVPIKDPITLLRAYRIAKNKIKDLNLIICGDGELRKECEKLADKNVYFLGFIRDIPSILKSADIFILTSLQDASPRSLMEAMAMGKPCIATDVSGVKEYLEGCGVLVEPKNPEKLAEAIIYLIENEDVAKELGRKARKKILNEHNLEKNIKKEIEILKTA